MKISRNDNGSVSNADDKNVSKKGIKDYIEENTIVFMYFFAAIFMEMIAVYAVEGNSLIYQPFIGLGILGMAVFLILALKNNKVRFYLCFILLVVQAVADLVFVVVYDMTDQYFDYGMLNLRNDAFGILESIPMNSLAFYSALLFGSIFVVVGLRYARRHPKIELKSRTRVIYCILATICISFVGFVLNVNNSDSTDKYAKMLKNTEGSNYAQMGILGNFVNEFAKGTIFTDTVYYEEESIENYIYKEVTEESPYFGVSKDNNVVMILTESFEWFSFIKNQEEYPNGLNISDKDLEYLFPNLTRFYNESVVMTNYHSKEKTDISETLSILGCYPTDAYVDYDFYENIIPHTVPNTLKNVVDPDIQCRSYHNGYKSFYNREQTHAMFGFEFLTDCYDMYEIADEALEKKVKEELSKKDEKKTNQNKDNIETESSSENKSIEENNAVEEVKEAENDKETEEGKVAEKDKETEEDKDTVDNMSEDENEAEEDWRKEAEELGLETSMHDYLGGGERNLDSEMIETCKHEMFPADKRFYTYITTITMHGMYYERENLKEYMDKLLEVYTPEGDEGEAMIMNYMTTVMDFDKALGIMMKDLEEKNLLDKTTIVMFSDHNSYYQQLSSYAKDIYDYNTERNYTDLYKVPLMIYDKNVEHQIIDKFTCTSDMVPTVFDLLGVKTYSNMYYGNSVFNEKESVLYSRAYGFFAGDGIVCRSLNNILYQNENVGADYLADFNKEAEKLIKKIEYCDQIFYQDFFSNKDNYDIYIENMKKIQTAK